MFTDGGIEADRLVLDGAFSTESPGTLDWQGGTLEVNAVVVQGGGLFERTLDLGTLAPARGGDGSDGPGLDIQLGGTVNAWLGDAAEHFEDVHNGGTLRAYGEDPNLYSSRVGGDYTQASGGALVMRPVEIDPGDVSVAGRLNVAGAASIDGALLWDRGASETWTPYASGKVTILQAGALTGRFAFVRDAETFGAVRYQRDGWQNGDTFGLVVEYDAGNGAITAQLARVGDVDLDQDVDRADLGQMIAGLEYGLDNPGAVTTWRQGNINGDPVTDGYDVFEIVATLGQEVTTLLPDLIYHQASGELSIDVSERAVAEGSYITSYQIVVNDPSKMDTAAFAAPLQREAIDAFGQPYFNASYTRPVGELFEYNPAGAYALFQTYQDQYPLNKEMAVALLQPGLSAAEYQSLFAHARWFDDHFTNAMFWGGFDLVVIPIPEPGVWVPVLAGVGLVAARRCEDGVGK